jgi:hypothetical protein
MTFEIGPHDQLSPGTPVRIGNYRGTVTRCDYVPASNGGMIAVHTVSLTEQRKGSRIQGKWKPLPRPKIWQGNYTAIRVIKP